MRASTSGQIAKRWMAGMLVAGCGITIPWGMSAASGQDAPVASAAEGTAVDPATKCREVLKKWNDLDKELSDLADKYAASKDKEEQATIRADYTKKVAGSDKVLAELRDAARAAFAAAPNEDGEVTKVLIGLVAYDYRRDDYDAAIDLGKQLEAGGVNDLTLAGILGSAEFRTDNFAAAEKHLQAANQAGKLDPDSRGELADIPKYTKLWQEELEKREKDAAKNNLPQVRIQTSKGQIVVELFEDEAPDTVGNFVSLVEKGFYNGSPFHRVLPAFMAQCGDPTGTGSGGPGYNIFCECTKPGNRKHFRGTLSMAHAGKDTGGSQFFLTFKPTPHLDEKHTVFGRVIEGFPVLAQLQRRDPTAKLPPEADKIEKMEVIRKRDHEYKPNKSRDKE